MEKIYRAIALALLVLLLVTASVFAVKYADARSELAIARQSAIDAGIYANELEQRLGKIELGLSNGLGFLQAGIDGASKLQDSRQREIEITRAIRSAFTALREAYQKP